MKDEHQIIRDMEKAHEAYLANKRNLGLQSYDFTDAMRAAYEVVKPYLKEDCIDEGCPHFGTPVDCKPYPGGCIATVKGTT